VCVCVCMCVCVCVCVCVCCIIMPMLLDNIRLYLWLHFKVSARHNSSKQMTHCTKRNELVHVV
jgi:hypothetical protein